MNFDHIMDNTTTVWSIVTHHNMENAYFAKIQMLRKRTTSKWSICDPLAIGISPTFEKDGQTVVTVWPNNLGTVMSKYRCFENATPASDQFVIPYSLGYIAKGGGKWPNNPFPLLLNLAEYHPHHVEKGLTEPWHTSPLIYNLKLCMQPYYACT